MQQFNIKVLVISISSPLLIGIYEDDKLVERFTGKGKTSDILPIIFKKILKKYDLNEIVYVNGPGSYMSIKIAYIFLKTISIINSIDFKSISGFDLNNNSPIKALGKKYFFRDKKDNSISINMIGDHVIKGFELPEFLNELKIDNDTLPEYNLPAV